MKYYIVRILSALFVMGSIPGGLLAGAEYGMLFGWITFTALAALGIILHKNAKEIEQGSRRDSIDMTTSEADLKVIYLNMISEAIARLRAAQVYLASYNTTQTLPDLESAILQIRKSLEATAFAAIAPNKSAYESFRAKAENQPDYRKDYHAGRILHSLSEINKNFYPLALLPATRKADGSWHFERKMSGYLTKKRFETFYDRLGKHLHAHNPWSNNKNLQNVISDMPNTIEEIFGLLEFHVTFIQTPEFHGAWIVEAKRDGAPPRIITGTAEGEFIVEGN